jgi:uncharacterized protein (TIGR03382 family)
MVCFSSRWIINLYRVTVCLGPYRPYLSYPSLTILLPFVVLSVLGVLGVRRRTAQCRMEYHSLVKMQRPSVVWAYLGRVQ